MVALIEQKDYTIKRLDEWYYQRFEEKYTRELARRVMLRTFVALKSPFLMLRLAKKVVRNMSVGGQLDDRENYFSRDYLYMERLFENKEEHFEFISGGMRKENGSRYGGALFRTFNSLKLFVEHVRKESAESFPYVLEDRVIEECFKRVFRSPDEFSELMASEIDAKYSEHSVIFPLMRSSEVGLRRYASSLKRAYIYLFREVFSDLYK